VRVPDHHINVLFDLLVAEQGVTISRIASRLGVPVRQAHQAVKEMRMTFGEDSDINVICENQGWGKPPHYVLVGNFSEAKEYLFIRLGDAETRLRTIHAVARSAVRGFESDAYQSYHAKAMELTLRQAMEHLSFLLNPEEAVS
jgi:hypothetical protein